MPTSTSSKIIFRTARVLFFTNAVIWFLFGIISVGKNSDNLNIPLMIQTIIAILMFGNAVFMGIAGFVITKHISCFYYLAIIVILVNILLTFTDQVGLFDWLTAVIDIILLSLLIASRRMFLSPLD